MTREDIIRMAREAKGNAHANKYTPGDTFFAFSIDRLEHFSALVAAAEREACAKVCDPEPSLPNEAYTVLNNKATLRRCAAAIRARSYT